MPLTLSEDISQVDLEQIARVSHAASQTPNKPVHRAFNPVRTGPDARQEEIDSNVQFYLKAFWGKPKYKWVKIVDTDTGNIVAASLWVIEETNPFTSKEPETIVADWFPEGPKRDFATQALADSKRPRQRMMQCPHVFLQIMFTDPPHRRRGAGGMMMEWGTALADRLGLEIYLDAVPVAVTLYESYGFRVVWCGEIRPKCKEHPPSLEWRELEDDVSPMAHIAMWRPLNGVFVPGKTKKPWDGVSLDFNT